MRLFANAKYDFIGQRRPGPTSHRDLHAAGADHHLARGLNYSVEFTGGTLIQVHSQTVVDVGAVRDGLSARGINGAEIQTFGSDQEIVIRARVTVAGTDADNTQIPAPPWRKPGPGARRRQLRRRPHRGGRPQGGRGTPDPGVLAILLSFVAVLAYLAYRFEWRFGVAAVVATAHDVIATSPSSDPPTRGQPVRGGRPPDDARVFPQRHDRDLRPDSREPPPEKREDFESILNRSINETLPRTIFTARHRARHPVGPAVLAATWSVRSRW